jgi:hypothetical protein
VVSMGGASRIYMYHTVLGKRDYARGLLNSATCVAACRRSAPTVGLGHKKPRMPRPVKGVWCPGQGARDGVVEGNDDAIPQRRVYTDYLQLLNF